MAPKLAIQRAEKYTLVIGVIFCIGISVFLLLNVSQVLGIVCILACIFVFLFSLYPIIGMYLAFLTFPFIEGQFYVTGVFSLPYADAFLIFTFIGYVISRIWKSAFYGKRIQKQEFVLLLPFLFFFLAYMISLINAEYLLNSLKFVFRPIAFIYLAYVFLTYNIIQEKKHLINILWLMVIAGIVITIISLTSLFYLEENQFLRIRPVGIFDWWPLGQNQNVLAQSYIVIIPAIILLALEQKKILTKKILMIFSVVMILLTLATFSRAAWVALMIQAILVIIFKFRNQLREVIKYGWIILILGIPFLIFMSQLLVSNISVSANKNRLLLTDIAISALYEHPFIGHGAGSFMSLVSQDRWYLLWFGHPLDSHGFIQKIMAEAGIVGLIAFSYLLYSILKNIFNAHKQAKNKDWLLTMLIMIISIIVFQLFNTSYFTAVMWLPIGLAMAVVKLETKGLLN